MTNQPERIMDILNRAYRENIGLYKDARGGKTMKELVMYATGNNGDGYVQEVGRYTDAEEVEIRIGLFAKDTVLTFSWQEVTED